MFKDSSDTPCRSIASLRSAFKHCCAVFKSHHTLNAAKQRLNTERSEVLEPHEVGIERRQALECRVAAFEQHEVLIERRQALECHEVAIEHQTK